MAFPSMGWGGSKRGPSCLEKKPKETGRRDMQREQRILVGFKQIHGKKKKMEKLTPKERRQDTAENDTVERKEKNGDRNEYVCIKEQKRIRKANVFENDKQARNN